MKKAFRLLTKRCEPRTPMAMRAYLKAITANPPPQRIVDANACREQ